MLLFHVDADDDVTVKRVDDKSSQNNLKVTKMTVFFNKHVKFRSRLVIALGFLLKPSVASRFIYEVTMLWTSRRQKNLDIKEAQSRCSQSSMLVL